MPIVDNTDVEARTAAEGWTALLARHLVEPVRWREVQLALRDELGVTEAIEVAPAGTLAALARRTIGEVALTTLDAPVAVG